MVHQGYTTPFKTGDEYEVVSAGDSEDGKDGAGRAGEGGIGEGDFHIDPRGDGSFATSAARCFRAVIHRIPVARQALPRVHGGFWEVYSKLREKVLSTLAVEMQGDYQPLYLTGHSLGGALASLAAYDIAKNFTLPDPITLYTFGSPKVGNGVFARKMQQRVKHHFRVVNDGDLVTALPNIFGTYDHSGCKVVVDSERYGNFTVAPTMVEETFGAKPLTSVGPHFLGQYRECLEACMGEADLKDYVCDGIRYASGRDTKALVKAMAVRRVDLQDDVPTCRKRIAAEGREVTHLRRRFSFVLQQARSQRARHHLCRQGMVSMEAARPYTASEATDAPPGLSPQLQARDDGDGELEPGKPQRKRRRTTRSSALPGPSSMVVEEGVASTVGPDDAASEDASLASLVETALSVCSQE